MKPRSVRRGSERDVAALVLVVDDDPDLRQMLTTALKTRGHQIAAAASGKERVHPRLISIAAVSTHRRRGLEVLLEPPFDLRDQCRPLHEVVVGSLADRVTAGTLDRRPR